MNITLQKIWEYPAEALRPVLLKKNRDLTGNLQFDRAVVALIYYNANMLAPIDQQWVAYPQFAEAAKQTKDLSTLIQVLKRPFANKFMITDLLLFTIENMAKKVVSVYSKHLIVDSDTYGRLIVNPIFILTMSNFNFAEGKFDDSKTSFSNTFTKLVWTVIGNRESHHERFDRDAQLAKVDKLAARQYFDYYQPTMEAMNIVGARIPAEVKANPDALIAALNNAALKVATQVKAVEENQPLALEVNKVSISSRIFDFTNVITPLLDFDISGMERTFRCYYLYLIWDLISEIPPIPQRDVLLAKLEALIKQYGYQAIFAEIPLVVASGLSPLTGNLDPDTKAGLSRLIGEFASRPPTRTEVLARIAIM